MENGIMQHYMTAAQAQTLLNAIKDLDVVKSMMRRMCRTPLRC